MKAIIVGGGIAGPVAALALRKAGIEAAVYEAHGQTADGVGGILSLAPLNKWKNRMVMFHRMWA